VAQTLLKYQMCQNKEHVQMDMATNRQTQQFTVSTITVPT